MVAWLAFAAGPLYGVNSQSLSLIDAREKALSGNPGLAGMQARYEALSEVPSQVGTLPDPVMSFNVMNLPEGDFDRHQENMTQLQLGISQMFPFPGKLDLRETVAEFEAEAALYSLGEMRLNLDRLVSVTWWELHFKDRSLDTVKRNQALLRQFVKVAKTKYEVGKGLQQDVLLAQLEIGRAHV